MPSANNSFPVTKYSCMHVCMLACMYVLVCMQACMHFEGNVQCSYTILSLCLYTQQSKVYSTRRHVLHPYRSCMQEDPASVQQILHLRSWSCIHAGTASMQYHHPCRSPVHAGSVLHPIHASPAPMQVLHPCRSCINAGPASMHVLNPCRSYTSETNSNSKSFHEDPASMQHVLHIHAGLTSMQVLHPCMTLHAGPAYIRSFIFIHAGPTFMQILYTCRFYTSETNTNSNHI